MNGSRKREAPGERFADPSGPQHDSETIVGFHLSAAPDAMDLIPESDRDPRIVRAMAKLAQEALHLRAALARAYQRMDWLETLADRDSLVSAYNRRAFIRELSRTLHLLKRYGTRASVVYFDVNGMKRINDSLGHSAGDRALHVITELLSASVRQSDVVGRLGGDEFAVILLQTDEDSAKAKARTLARQIANTPVTFEGRTLRLTTAFGVHALSEQDTAASALLAADKAMYAQKMRQRSGAGHGGAHARQPTR